jgi:tetratricopeptide (TPR) repeat protein
MPRNGLRVFSVLLLIFLAIFTPLVLSGYSEMKKAFASTSYTEAAQHYQNAADRLLWRPDLYELSGHAYYYAKDYTQANAEYQKAFQHDALSPDGWVAWGDVNYLKDDQRRATEIWQQALEKKNPSDHLYSRLAQIYQSNGNYSKAAQYLEKYASAHSEEASAHYRLGLLLTLTDSDRALSELIQAAQLDPQFDPAAETLRSALNLASPNDADSARLVLTGRGLGLVNEWQLARAAFASAVKADEKNAEAWAWLGEANQQTDGAGDADLDRALRLNPDSPIVRGLRGLHFQRIGNFRQALEEFQYAAKLQPKDPTWLVSIGETHAKLGDLIQALKDYQSATTLAPKDPNYWRLLAIFCAQNNINIKDIGLPAAQKALILGKLDTNSLDVLGWLLMLANRYKEAERMLNHALELDPQNSSAHLHVGLLYLQTDNRTSAYDHLMKSRELGNSEASTLLEQFFP